MKPGHSKKVVLVAEVAGAVTVRTGMLVAAFVWPRHVLFIDLRQSNFGLWSPLFKAFGLDARFLQIFMPCDGKDLR
jgi:hypothetical protein